MAKTSVAHTEADICNLALIQDGAKASQLINSLADSDTSDNAQLCRRLYPLIKDICLTRWEWNGITKFADLGGARDDDDQEQADYEFVFNLPDDCMQVVAQIDEGNHKRKVAYIAKGRQLYTNHKSNNAGDSAYIDYISIADVSKFSPQLIEYIALKLAIALAPSIMGISEESQLHIQGMQRELRLRVLPEAIGRNQAEGDPDGGNDEGESTWVKGRSKGTNRLSRCDCCGGFPCRC